MADLEREWCEKHGRFRLECGFYPGYPHGEVPVNSKTKPAIPTTKEDDPMRRLGLEVMEILSSVGLKEEHLTRATGQIVELLQRFSQDSKV